MDGTGGYYTKVNEPVGDKYYMISQEESNEENKLMSNTKPETWKHETLTAAREDGKGRRMVGRRGRN